MLEGPDGAGAQRPELRNSARAIHESADGRGRVCDDRPGAARRRAPVADSFKIAEYLDDAYPDRPTLFGGEGGRALSRFVESWTQRTIHPFVSTSRALLDIHYSLAAPDQAYFRQSREKIFGKPLEAVIVGDEARLEGFLDKLKPLRSLLDGQKFLGGATPLFADYIVFGAFQWLRIVSPWQVLPAGDAVSDWFERCLDLHGGEGRKVSAAA